MIERGQIKSNHWKFPTWFRTPGYPQMSNRNCFRWVIDLLTLLHNTVNTCVILPQLSTLRRGKWPFLHSQTPGAILRSSRIDANWSTFEITHKHFFHSSVHICEIYLLKEHESTRDQNSRMFGALSLLPHPLALIQQVRLKFHTTVPNLSQSTVRSVFTSALIHFCSRLAIFCGNWYEKVNCFLESKAEREQK